MSKTTVKPFRDLKHRLWISICASIIALLLIYFSQVVLVQFALALVLSFIIFIGVIEWTALLEKKKIKTFRNLLLGFAALFMMTTYLSVLGYEVANFNIFIAFVFGLLMCISHFRQVNHSILSISSNLLGILIVVLPLSLILFILYPQNGEDGRLWLTYLLIVTKMTDIGGYFIGKIWGKRKLAPHLSPKKTMEGSIGGLAFSTLSSLGFFLFAYFLDLNFSMSLLGSIFMGFLLGILAQFGDLTESLFKRDAQIKDSNNIPGIGGILDMFDSLIFTTPMLYLFMRMS